MDPETQREQFERQALPHLDILWAAALRLARGDEARAEDYLQDTLLQAFRSWHTFRPGTNCRAWLTAILRNTMVNHFRASGRRGNHVDYDAVSERTVFESVDSVDLEGDFFERMVDHEVTRAIDALPLVYREALILSDVEGLNQREIAAVLEVPRGTVKSRLFRARKALQAELYDYARTTGYLSQTQGDAASPPGSRQTAERVRQLSALAARSKTCSA